MYIQNSFLRARPLNVMYFFKAARYHFMFKLLEFWLRNEKARDFNCVEGGNVKRNGGGIGTIA